MHAKLKKPIKSKYMFVSAVLAAIIIVVCVAFSIHYVKKGLIESEQKNAVNLAMMVAKNYSITDSEVEYMKSLSFNEMEKDPINHRLADVATGIDFNKPLISVYVVAPLGDTEIKYTIDESSTDFFGLPIGTKLNAIWLLNMAVDKDGNAEFKEREDIYRYTTITEEIQKGIDSKQAYGTHSIDEWGDVVSGCAPLYSTEGNFVGLVGIDFDYAAFNKKINQTLIFIAFVLGISMLLLMLVFFFIYGRYSAEYKQNRDALQKEKESLTLILNNIPIGIIVYRWQNSELSMVEVNHSLCEMMCLTKDKLLTNKNEDFLTLVYKDDLELCKDVMNRLVVPGTDLTYEYRSFHRVYKKYVWISGHGKSVEQPDGSVYVYLAYTDISARKELEQTEKKLLEAEKMAEAKAEFYSRMSHDMRTPMNGILGIAELAKADNNETELKEDLEKIEQSGKYMLNLINDTLDYQRLESGKIQLNSDVVYAADFLQNTFQVLQVTAKSKGVTFTCDAQGIDSHWYIRIDEMHIKQVVINLISNAIKFTPKDGEVSFKIERMGMEGKICHEKITIEDTGIGMSKTFIEQGLFKPFSQEKNDVTMNVAGSGLGLSIVKSLVELMGGRIEVESELGVGTKFTIYLDIERVNRKDAEEHNKQDAMQLNSTIDLTGKTILLCEDHPLNAEIVKRLLNKVHADVEWAKDGEMGVEMFQKSDSGHYAAILMDIRMPVMDGIEATNKIRKLKKSDAKSVPIIAMSANAYEEDRKKSLDAGMNEHLPKPVEAHIVYETLKKCIE